MAMVLLAVGASGASAVPQGPWVLPATGLSADGQNAETPRVATGPDGTTTAVWTRSNGSNSIVRASVRPPGGTFGPVTDLSGVDRDSLYPQVDTSPDGAVTVVWQRVEGAKSIVQQTTMAPGGTFGPVTTLSDPDADSKTPQVLTGPDGSTTVVWSSRIGTDLVVQATTRAPGGDFGLATNLSDEGKSAYEPNVGTSLDGTTIAIWREQEGADWIVKSATRPPNGTFGTATAVSAPGGNAVDLQVTTAPDGTTTAVWDRHDGVSWGVQAATRAPGGTFGQVTNLSAAGQDASSVRAQAAPDGTTTVVWKRFNGTNWIIQSATRFPGGGFGPAVNLSAPGADSGTPEVSVGPDGTATVVWTRAGMAIQSVTRPPGGDFGPVTDLSAQNSLGFLPHVTTGPDGVATAVWRSPGASNWIIQAASTEPPTFALTVSKHGSGAGHVKSEPGGINCGATCAGEYLSMSKVTLAMDPAAGSTFAGWGGACASFGQNPTCEVTMNQVKQASVTFNTPGQTVQFPLTVDKQGTGVGGVTSAPAGIDCGQVCDNAFDAGTQVILTAAPNLSSTFGGWGGACAGAGQSLTCQVTVNQVKLATATFNRQGGVTKFPLTVLKQGAGQGGVTSTPAGVDCGVDCEVLFNGGTQVTLTAAPDQGSSFSGWGGTCASAGQALTCQVTMDQARQASATFNTQGEASRVPFTVDKHGAGQGGVTSAPAGIDCGQTCESTFFSGTQVTLTATPAQGATFGGWGGACAGAGQDLTCQVTVFRAGQASATFNAPGGTDQFPLTILRQGSGNGRVFSAPAGIDCTQSCEAVFDEGTQVTLTAAPAGISTFGGWGGTCASAGQALTCQVTMDQARQASATFNTPGEISRFPLTVEKQGTGKGGVVSAPAGIDCGQKCDIGFDQGVQVTLTATPAQGSVFGGWGGACASAGQALTCQVTVDQSKLATATFDTEAAIQFPLTVAKQGTGTGQVTSAPAGIDCGQVCEKAFDTGTVVTLTATPAQGSTFGGWGGTCAGAGQAPTCQVTVDQAKQATATFDLVVVPPEKKLLTVAVVGQGTGKVASSPAGIDCGTDCEESYLSGTKVTLTATPAADSTFTGWSGACASAASAPSCVVTMDEARSAVATFAPQPTDTTAVFDGKFVYIRLKCSARFKPSCRGNAQAFTKKPKTKKVKVKKNGKVKFVKKAVRPLPKAMTSRVSAAQKAGKWKILKLKVKPAFKNKIIAMSKQPTKKTLLVKFVLSAKKYKHGKKSTIFHKYRVRTAS